MVIDLNAKIQLNICKYLGGKKAENCSIAYNYEVQGP